MLPQTRSEKQAEKDAGGRRPQRRTVTLDFAIPEKVSIKELGCWGVVIAIHLDGSGAQYKVRYFDDAEAREVYFYEWELESNEA